MVSPSVEPDPRSADPHLSLTPGPLARPTSAGVPFWLANGAHLPWAELEAAANSVRQAPPTSRPAAACTRPLRMCTAGHTQALAQPLVPLCRRPGACPIGALNPLTGRGLRPAHPPARPPPAHPCRRVARLLNTALFSFEDGFDQQLREVLGPLYPQDLLPRLAAGADAAIQARGMVCLCGWVVVGSETVALGALAAAWAPAGCKRRGRAKHRQLDYCSGGRGPSARRTGATAVRC